MKTNRLNIVDVVKQRLNLQTVQRNITNKFDILFPNVDKFRQSAFLKTFASWDQDKQKAFLIELGGQVNLQRTKDWILNQKTTS